MIPMNHKSSFPWRAFLKSVAAIAVPVALQNLLTTTGSMIDTVMLASLGKETVGGVGLCAQFSSLMFSGYWGFVGGGILFMSQYFGAKDDDGVNRAYGLTLSCMMVVGLIFMTLAVAFPGAVMRIYTDKPVIQKPGEEYLAIVGFAYPLQIFSMAMCALLRSTRRVRIPMFGAVASVATNAFLNWVLIHGKLGFPRMGVRGAALKSYFHKCFPILMNEILIGVGNMVINVVLGRQSEEAIAATAVFRTLEGLVIGFFAGFSNASAVLVGNGIGAGRLDEAYERAWRLVYLCGSCILTVCLLLLAVHAPVLKAMSLSGESLTIGTGMLIVYCVAATVRMCNWTQNDTFRAAGDAAYGTILEIAFMYAMVLPMVCLTGRVWHSPFLLIFACCYIDEPIRFVLMHRHLYSGKWIKPVTPQGQAALPAFREKHAHKKAS